MNKKDTQQQSLSHEKEGLNLQVDTLIFTFEERCEGLSKRFF